MMKHFFTLIAVLSGVCMIHAQNSFSRGYSAVDSTFQSFDAMCLLANDDVLLAGSFEYPQFAQRRLSLVKMDDQGNLLWSKQIALGGYKVNGIREGQDAYYMYGALNITYSFLMKVDTTGNVIWMKHIVPPVAGSWHYVADAIVIQDRVLFTGCVNIPPATGLSYGFMIELDTSGAVLWTRTYHAAGKDVRMYETLREQSGSLLVLAGVGWTDSLGIHGDAVILRMDSIGNILTTVRLDDWYPSLIVTVNNRIFLGGTAEPLNAQSLDAGMIAELDSSLVPQWSTRYETPPYQFGTPQSIGIDSAGNVRMISTAHHMYDFATVVGYDPVNGIPLTSFRLGINDMFQCVDAQIEDEHIHATGYSWDYTNTNYRARYMNYKTGDSVFCELSSYNPLFSMDTIIPATEWITDSTGITLSPMTPLVFQNFVLYPVSCELTSAPETLPPEQGISIFPNPANDLLTVNLNGLEADHVSFRITDLTGKLVLTEEFEHTAQFDVDVSNLPAGSYIGTVVSEGVVFHQILIFY